MHVSGRPPAGAAAQDGHDVAASASKPVLALPHPGGPRALIPLEDELKPRDPFLFCARYSRCPARFANTSSDGDQVLVPVVQSAFDVVAVSGRDAKVPGLTGEFDDAGPACRNIVRSAILPRVQVLFATITRQGEHRLCGHPGGNSDEDPADSVYRIRPSVV